MQKIPFEILNLQGDGYHLLIEVTLFGHTSRMVIDTGASKTVLDKHQLLAAGIAEDTFQATDILSSGLGTNSMESFTLQIPTLAIGPWETHNFTTAVLDLSSINYAYEHMGFAPVIGVLGGDILHSYGAIIHYKKKYLALLKHKCKS